MFTKYLLACIFAVSSCFAQDTLSSALCQLPGSSYINSRCNSVSLLHDSSIVTTRSTAASYLWYQKNDTPETIEQRAVQMWETGSNVEEHLAALDMFRYLIEQGHQFPTMIQDQDASALLERIKTLQTSDEDDTEKVIASLQLNALVHRYQASEEIELLATNWILTDRYGEPEIEFTMNALKALAETGHSMHATEQIAMNALNTHLSYDTTTFSGWKNFHQTWMKAKRATELLSALAESGHKFTSIEDSFQQCLKFDGSDSFTKKLVQRGDYTEIVLRHARELCIGSTSDADIANGLALYYHLTYFGGEEEEAKSVVLHLLENQPKLFETPQLMPLLSLLISRGHLLEESEAIVNEAMEANASLVELSSVIGALLVEGKAPTAAERYLIETVDSRYDQRIPMTYYMIAWARAFERNGQQMPLIRQAAIESYDEGSVESKIKALLLTRLLVEADQSIDLVKLIESRAYDDAELLESSQAQEHLEKLHQALAPYKSWTAAERYLIETMEGKYGQRTPMIYSMMFWARKFASAGQQMPLIRQAAIESYDEGSVESKIDALLLTRLLVEADQSIDLVKLIERKAYDDAELLESRVAQEHLEKLHQALAPYRSWSETSPSTLHGHDGEL